MARELAAFLADGEPPIVFTPGTAMRHADRFFETSIQASIELGRRALLLTHYADQIPSRLPPGVATAAYVPFATLLPLSAALVHHGGIGTSAQALAAGIPQLVKPMTFDQPDNAVRLERLGVGLSIRPDHYERRAVAAVLDVLLNSQAISQKCRLSASWIDSAGALARSCEAIETVAANSKPPNNSMEPTRPARS
jgi:UDP:flavonoid glycosyltransferase YjiC (YdhE family)